MQAKFPYHLTNFLFLGRMPNNQLIYDQGT